MVSRFRAPGALRWQQSMGYLAGGAALAPNSSPTPSSTSALNADLKLAELRDYVSRHREDKHGKVIATRLDSMRLHVKTLSGCGVWRVGGAVVIRVTEVPTDMDGIPTVYHEPTNEHFDGHPPGRDSLLNAVGRPNPKGVPYGDPHDEKHLQAEQKFLPTSGCQLLRDYYKAKHLRASGGVAAEEATKQILAKYGLASFDALEQKSKTAICVKYIGERSKDAAKADWGHVEKWVGVQLDKNDRPKLSAKNPGFYVPAIVPRWANAEEHPWVVWNKHLADVGVHLGNPAVGIANGMSPTVAFGLLADAKNIGFGECSEKMVEDLAATRTGRGDYIFVLFPGEEDVKERPVDEIRTRAAQNFASWSVDGRKGKEAILELFPSRADWERKCSEYLTQLPGAFPPAGMLFRRSG